MFKNTMTLARKYGSKVAFVSAPVLLMAQSARAATDPISTLLASVDLSTVAVSIGAATLLIIGIALAFKAPDVTKRVVRKV